nr:helix-turn-helix domain-containing protein [uncultured Rhodopila sp.]
MITREQLRAARALLHIEQAELARRAQVSVVTIRRIEAADVVTRVAPAKLEAVRRALEEAGIEFIPNGVARRANGAEQAALFRGPSSDQHPQCRPAARSERHDRGGSV